MKITRIETHVCNARMRNWVFVKVVTDQDGLFGWGEATLEWHTRAVVGAVSNCAELIIGEDPTRIEHLWQMMYRQHFWHGHGIVRATAIAGIDLALWDILGKVCGVPCSKLWGGPVRDRVRTYCHLGGGKMEDFYETATEDAKRFADLAREAVANGFTAFKSMAVPPTLPLEGLKPIRTAEKCVAAMREAVGESIDIMVDCHARPSPAMGLQFAKALEPYGLYFFEEPCWPESVDGLAMINKAVSTPIATGERVTNLSAFRDLFNAHACEVCQVDITHCGGLSEARRIAALAEAHRISLAPHNPQGPVSTAASLEFGFSQPSYIICETVHADVPWRADVVQEGFTVEPKGRFVTPNTRPGLGIVINEAEVKKHPFEQELPQRVFYSDGSVGDWQMPKKLAGVLAIAHTPFTDGDEIDAPALKRAVDWSFGVGADGIGTGMVSETLELTTDERHSLAKMLVEFVGGRGPVFAAVGAESTKQSLGFAVAAEKAGCDAVMAVPPLTAKLSVEHLVDHFRALADGIGIPVIVQDASGYVGQSIPIPVCVKLLERYGPEKILFKPEAAPNGPTLSALRDATSGRATMFEGSGGIFLIDSFRRGIAGTMPGMDLLDGVVAVWKALQRGDEAAAYRVYFPVCALVALQLQAGLDGFLAVEKHLMVRRGLFPSARRRKPYGWELDAETAAEVDRLFAQLRQALGERGA